MLYFQKGLSRQTAHTIGRALTLAGQQGCALADTGHILLAMLQTAQGPVADFLRRKTSPRPPCRTAPTGGRAGAIRCG